eukprot:5999760-Pyramimonas_sp.AAC.1
MAEEADPTEAAPAGHASGDSIAVGVACKTDTSTDSRHVVTEAMVHLKRRIAHRAEGAGWGITGPL